MATEAAEGVRSVTTRINYLARHCDNPSVNNGDFTRNVFPLESATVEILDAASFEQPPSLDVEGFARIPFAYDNEGLDADHARAAYRAALRPIIQAFTGADEIHMADRTTIRRQAATKIEGDVIRSVVADFVHSDSTASGALQFEARYPPPQRPGVRRTAQLNLWRLLSATPTPMPLALCDARSVHPGDVTPGPAYFPSFDENIDTSFYHPNDHFRWVYFSDLTDQQLLVFKQYDSDPHYPPRVPHVAFRDPSCPPDAEPRTSIETRCLLRWYE